MRTRYQDKLHYSVLLQLPECFQRLESPFVSLYFTLSIYEEEDKGDENEVLGQVTLPPSLCSCRSGSQRRSSGRTSSATVTPPSTRSCTVAAARSSELA